MKEEYLVHMNNFAPEISVPSVPFENNYILNYGKIMLERKYIKISFECKNDVSYEKCCKKKQYLIFYVYVYDFYLIK